MPQLSFHGNNVDVYTPFLGVSILKGKILYLLSQKAEYGGPKSRRQELLTPNTFNSGLVGSKQGKTEQHFPVHKTIKNPTVSNQKTRTLIEDELMRGYSAGGEVVLMQV